MTILLLRHGETLLNVSRTIQPAATPLGPRGLAQAQALARRLAAMNIGAIVSSDLPRAWQTAEAIAAACRLPVVREPLLQERNFGDLRGRSRDALDFDPLTMPEAPPGGESVAMFRDRVSRAFARIVALRAGLGSGNLAVVTHGLVIGAMLERHLQHAGATVVPARIGNTSLTMFAAEPPHCVSLLDCTVHLDDGIAEDPLSLSGG